MAEFYIPSYSIDNRLTYFMSLRSDVLAKDGHIINNRLQKLKKALVEGFDADYQFLLSQVYIDATTGNSNIDAAIEFLNNVAHSERNKELAVLKNYKEKLQPLTKLKNFPDVNTLIDQLTNFSNNLTAGFTSANDLKDFYLKLSAALNTIRQSLESTKQRLDILKTDYNKLAKDSGNDKTYEVIKRDYLFRLPSLLDTLLKGMVGTRTRYKENSTNQQIQTAAYQIFEKLIHQRAAAVLDNPAGALIAIAGDFTKWVSEQVYNKKFGNEVVSLEDITDSIWKELTDTYLQTANTEFLQRLENNSVLLDTQLKDIESALGLGELTSLKAKRQRLQDIEKGKRAAYSKTINAGMRAFISNEDKKLQEIYENKFKYITWNFTAKDSKGNTRDKIKEAVHSRVEEVLGGGLKINYEAATDNIELGQLRGIIPDDDNNAFDAILLEYKQKMEEYAKAQLQSIDNNDARRQAYREMGEELQRLQNKITNMLSLISGSNVPENIFIYHDSLKLYITKTRDNSKKMFHGRTINILSVLNTLYTQASNFSLQMPSEDLMYMIAYNIAPGALGEGLSDPITQYISIFAGLLMFDDVQNMASDLVEQIKNNFLISGSTAQVIHMYNLNGVYVPASYILTNMANALSQTWTQKTLDANQYASTEILYGNAPNIIASYPLPEDKPLLASVWSRYASQIIAEIQVKIEFFYGFVDFASELLEKLQ